MKTKTFRYLGPDSAVTFRGGLHVRLLHGRDVELPADSNFVRDLIARGMLAPVEGDAAPPSRRAPKGDTSPVSLRAPKFKPAKEATEAAPAADTNPDAKSVEKGN